MGRTQLSLTLTERNDSLATPRHAYYDLVAVIINWNLKDLLATCLGSLSAAIADLSVHTVVVDNNSSDGSPEMVERLFPDVELIRNQENIGFARANNLALRRYQETAKYLLLLNPDTIVLPDSLRKMIEFMDTHTEAGIAGCKVMKPDGSLDWACKRSFIYPSVLFYKALGLDRRFPQSPRFGRYHLTFLDPDQIHEVDSVVGAFLLIRRDCIQNIGLLDENFFMYGEDLDWCYRARTAGWKIYYVPTTYIVHHKGQTTRKSSQRMTCHWYSATWRAYDKHLATRYPFVVNALVWAGFKIMCGFSLLANLLRAGKRVPSRL